MHLISRTIGSLLKNPVNGKVNKADIFAIRNDTSQDRSVNFSFHFMSINCVISKCLNYRGYTDAVTTK